MPQVTLSPTSHGLVSLWETKFCSFVEVVHPPKDCQSLRGKVCIWSTDNALIPLDDPQQQITIRDMERELQVFVRYLTEGEVLTIKF